MNARPNIVLVHGAWADGSSWSGVIERLQAAGYHVTAPQFPMSSLAAAVQQGLAGSAFTDVMGVPAWKSLPSWYLVATNDEAIPPDAERMFARRMGATTVEVPSSHVAMVSHPDEVTQLITAAADTCAAAER
jgi:pimeloyl-ACP methyl ester carboxylesterase